ncbi:Zc3h12a-like ribonuclease NYN domain protein [Toxoplasma gondii MAS]|uniref:Zc3h12a-like ribonuclease NYN domain protein n=1 Tax=Toxoplasma gondii MAS TaxID=943118 RepID=A0A086QZ99_TOXGO|nr:Zc3h12a-like ribonuclease NYN domain protein [Toxoplasma gondii MAS]
MEEERQAARRNRSETCVPVGASSWPVNETSWKSTGDSASSAASVLAVRGRRISEASRESLQTRLGRPTWWLAVDISDAGFPGSSAPSQTRCAYSPDVECEEFLADILEQCFRTPACLSSPLDAASLGIQASLSSAVTRALAASSLLRSGDVHTLEANNWLAAVEKAVCRDFSLEASGGARRAPCIQAERARGDERGEATPFASPARSHSSFRAQQTRARESGCSAFLFEEARPHQLVVSASKAQRVRRKKEKRSEKQNAGSACGVRRPELARGRAPANSEERQKRPQGHLRNPGGNSRERANANFSMSSLSTASLTPSETSFLSSRPRPPASPTASELSPDLLLFSTSTETETREADLSDEVSLLAFWRNLQLRLCRRLLPPHTLAPFQDALPSSSLFSSARPSSSSLLASPASLCTVGKHSDVSGQPNSSSPRCQDASSLRQSSSLPSSSLSSACCPLSSSSCSSSSSQDVLEVARVSSTWRFSAVRPVPPPGFQLRPLVLDGVNVATVEVCVRRRAPLRLSSSSLLCAFPPQDRFRCEACGRLLGDAELAFDGCLLEEAVDFFLHANATQICVVLPAWRLREARSLAVASNRRKKQERLSRCAAGAVRRAQSVSAAGARTGGRRQATAGDRRGSVQLRGSSVARLGRESGCVGGCGRETVDNDQCPKSSDCHFCNFTTASSSSSGSSAWRYRRAVMVGSEAVLRLEKKGVLVLAPSRFPRCSRDSGSSFDTRFSSCYDDLLALTVTEHQRGCLISRDGFADILNSSHGMAFLRCILRHSLRFRLTAGRFQLEEPGPNWDRRSCTYAPEVSVRTHTLHALYETKEAAAAREMQNRGFS